MAKKIGYIKIMDDMELNDGNHLMTKFNEQCDFIFKDNISQNRSANIERNDMISRLIKDDIVIIKSLKSASTSLKDLLEFVHLVQLKGATIICLEEDWLNTTKENKSSTYLLQLIDNLYSFENEVHQIRVQTGITNARNSGKKFGRPPKDKDKINKAIDLYQTGQYTGDEICEKTGISRRTLYNYLKKYGIK